MNRRRFLNNTATAAGFGIIHQLSPLDFNAKKDLVHLTILHTNDVHSRIDPFPDDGSRNANQGGITKRAAVISEIRKSADHVLLLDAGDIFQGTPYFNMFGGELEMKLMSEMGYDAATIGNHDFDAGIAGLVKQLPYAKFPLIISNYGLSNTDLYGRTLTNKIWEFDGIRVGVYGLGIELETLVPKNLYKETVYNDPIAAAKRYEKFLKYEMDCDYVICLSHLGYKYRESKVSDVVLAQNTSSTNLIIGGHTHTFMKEPDIQKNTDGEEVIINQVGWAGIMMGRIDVSFDRANKKKALKGGNITIK